MIFCFLLTGLGIPDLLAAILTLMPLDSYVSDPVSTSTISLRLFKVNGYTLRGSNSMNSLVMSLAGVNSTSILVVIDSDVGTV